MRYSYTNRFIVWMANIVDGCGNIIFGNFHPAINNANIKKIIFVKVDNIGDCFLSTPIFSELKKINKDVIIDVVCLEASKEIFTCNKSISSVITIKNRTLSEIWKIRRKIVDGRYDIFIDARGYAKISLLGILSGVKVRMGFMEEVFNCFYTHKILQDKTKHESDKYSRILHQFGVSEPSSWIPLLNADLPEEFVKAFSKKIIAIHPGASLDYKRWPVKKWIELIRLILELSDDFEIAVLGSKEDMKINDEIIAGVNNDRTVNLAGKMSIPDVYGLLSKCSLFLGSDSALGHLAGPQAIPTIILMNSVIDKNRWSPLGPSVKTITGYNREHDCHYGKCAYPCANMDSITVEEVFNEIKEIIK